MDLLMVWIDMLKFWWGYHFVKGHIGAEVWMEAQSWHINKKGLMVPWMFFVLNVLKLGQGVKILMDNKSVQHLMNMVCAFLFIL